MLGVPLLLRLLARYVHVVAVRALFRNRLESTAAV